MLDRAAPKAASLPELPEITAATDTRAYLARAAVQVQSHDDYELIVDVDAHLQEGGFWPEIIDLLDNDVLKQTAQAIMRPGSLPLINMQPGMSFQALAGRVPHQSGPQEQTDDPAKAGHRFVQIVRRTIETMGLDYQVIFPTAMLHLGMNPMEDIEVELARAYARWLLERILPEDPHHCAALPAVQLAYRVREARARVRRPAGHHRLHRLRGAAQGRASQSVCAPVQHDRGDW